MAKSIIFIPRSPFLDSDRVMPTLGPLYLKSFLDSKGHEIIVDDSPDAQNIPDLGGFEVIGLSTTTPQYYCENGSRELAKKLREIYPKKKLIIGGAHAKNYYQETLKENVFDYIIRGDGEMPFLDILDGKKLPAVITSQQLTKEEINSMPLPWRDKEYLSKYKYEVGGRNASTAMTARYCPMRCKFCEEREMKVTLYSPEHADLELGQIKEIGFGGLMFYDDVLTLSRKRTSDICEVIKKHDIKYRCNGHAKILSGNEDLLEKLVDSGCVEVCLGIESGDQGILNNVGKGTEVEDIFGATRNILNSGMKVSAYLMMGLPGESKESIGNTEKYIQAFSKNPNFGFDLTIFYPYRHTYIRENIQEFDLILNNLEGSKGLYKGAGGYSECCISTSHLSGEEIKQERERLTTTYRDNFRGTKKS